MRWTPLALCLAAVCAIAAAPAPTTVALQYDEISRMVMAPSTPPPPGNFSDDYQLAMSATPVPSPPARKHGGFGALGAMMGGAMPPGMGNPGSMMDALNQMRMGRVTRYTLYPSKGWIRTDDPIAQTAVIAKCNEHQYITLDLNAKTYTISQTQPQQNCFPMEMGDRGRGGSHANQPSEPGTEDITVNATTKDLGPLTIDGISTKGTASDIAVSSSNATGSCHTNSNGTAAISTVTYISNIHAPRAFCLLANAPQIPTSPMQAISSGGCQPTVHGHADMSFDLSNIENLAMYTLIAVQGDRGGRGHQFGMLTERGHVASLGQHDADALFSIPPGFSEAK